MTTKTRSRGGELVSKETKIYYLNCTNFHKNYRVPCQRKIVLDRVKYEKKTLFLEIELNSNYNRDNKGFIIHRQGEGVIKLKMTTRNLVRYKGGGRGTSMNFKGGRILAKLD